MKNQQNENPETGKMVAVIFKNHFKVLMRIAKNKVKCDADAEDLVSDFILHYSVKMNDGREIGDRLNLPCILKSFGNYVIDFFRKKKSVRFSDLLINNEDGEESNSMFPDCAGNESTDDFLINSMNRKTLGELLDKLSEDNRQLLVMRFYERLDNPKIAERLNKSTDYIAMRIGRAKDAFRKILNKYKLQRDDF